MAEFMGKVTSVDQDQTVTVQILGGGYKSHEKTSRLDGTRYRVLTRNNKGKPVRSPSGLALQFMWSEVRNGPVKPGDTVMVEMQPVKRPVRKI